MKKGWVAAIAVMIIVEACSIGLTSPSRVAELREGMKPAAVEDILGTSPHGPTTIVVHGNAYHRESYMVEKGSSIFGASSVRDDYNASGQYVGPRGYDRQGAMPGTPRTDIQSIFLVYTKDSLVFWGDYRNMLTHANPDIQVMGLQIDSAYKAFYGE